MLLLATCFADIARKKLQRRDVRRGGEGKANNGQDASKAARKG